MSTGLLVETPVPSAGQVSSVRSRFRVVEAGLHFNSRDLRAQMVNQLLGQLVLLYTQVAQEILTALKLGFRLELGQAGKINRAVLAIPCSDPEDLESARELVNKPVEAGKIYTNSYRLVAVTEASTMPMPVLEFELARASLIEAKNGKEKRVLSLLPGTFFQRVITRWARPAGLSRLPRLLHDGVAQEVAQVFLSHIKLVEEGQPGRTSLPDFLPGDNSYAQALDRLVAHLNDLETRKVRGKQVVTDQLWTDCKPVSSRLLPLRFAQSSSTRVYLRREPAGPARLYVALPLGAWLEQNGASDQNLYWWRAVVDQFQPLPAWSEDPLTARQKVILIPLAVRGGQRRLRRWQGDFSCQHHRHFVRSLANPDWRVAWTLLTPRSEGQETDYFFQITLGREQEVLGRPNLLGIHFALEHSWLMIYWSLIAGGSQTHSGKIQVDYLPEIGEWPGAAERKRRAYLAARKVASLADSLDADLALEEVSGVKKRSSDGQANRLATRFNYSQLAHFICDKGWDHSPAVDTVALVSSYHLRDYRAQPHPEQATIVASEGWRIREQILARKSKQK